MSVRRGGITSSLIRSTADADVALGRLERIINEIIENIEVLSFEELQQIGIEIMELSQEKVPVDTGLLKASAYVSDDGEKTVEVGYDRDGDAPYAIFVHENLEAKHVNGEAKFLERAIDETVQTIVARIREKIARELK